MFQVWICLLVWRAFLLILVEDGPKVYLKEELLANMATPPAPATTLSAPISTYVATATSSSSSSSYEPSAKREKHAHETSSSSSSASAAAAAAAAKRAPKWFTTGKKM